MDNIVIYQSLTGLILLSGCMWLFVSKYREVQVDLFRQSMFAIRDELFDYAAAGNISFKNEGYQMLRHMMNAQLRCGPSLTLPKVVFMFFKVGSLESGKSFSDVLKYECRRLSPEVRRKMQDFYWRMNEQSIRHLYRMSPVIGTILFVAFWLLFKHRKMMENRLDRLDMEFYRIGRDGIFAFN